jgi:phage gpG-like protein
MPPRLKPSIRVISADESKIIVGSDVPYAQIHNDGGTINKSVTVKTHTVRQHSRTRKGRNETVKEHKVQAHTRKMNTTIPQRRFLGASYTLSKRMMNLITARFYRALKS